MNLRAVMSVAMLGAFGAVIAFERGGEPEARLTVLTSEAALAIRGGQHCYDNCLSPSDCPGGADDKCRDHICPGMGACPISLRQGTTYLNTQDFCDGCALVNPGVDECAPVGPSFYCDYTESCMGDCVFTGGQWRCPSTDLSGNGFVHQHHVAQGNFCFNP